MCRMSALAFILAVAVPAAAWQDPAPAPAAAATSQEQSAQVEAALARGRELTRLFTAGETDVLWQQMAPPMQAQLGSAATLAQFRSQVQDQLGEETELVAESSRQEQGQDVYTRRARFSKTGPTIIETVFVTSGETVISGFWIRPSQDQGATATATATGAATDDEPADARAQHDGIASAIPKRPTPVMAQGQVHLAYELRIANQRDEPVRLLGVEVTAGETERPLLSLSGERLGATYGGAPEPELAPGTELLLNLWISAAPTVALDSIRHRLRIDSGAGEESISGPGFDATGEPPVLAPPLRGANWVAANGPSNTSGHRRARIEVDGLRRIAQRFAIDFVQMRGETTFDGDPEDNASYFAYGAEALAVAEGTVVATKDGIPENVPGISSRAVEITLETVGGNHVILDIGNGRYAFYAHLQPGSLRVSGGDTVSTGQVLGLVGNSGNSTEPHLHFHLADAASPLGAEGIPYVFARFWRQGSLTDPEGLVPVAEAVEVHGEIPLENDVLAFER